MLFMVAYNDTHSLGDKARLVTACREEAARHSRFDVIPFETDAHMIDVLLQVPRTTYM